MDNSVRLMDIIERSLTGERMSEKDFDRNSIARGVKRVVKKYELKFPKDSVINNDLEMADRVYQAGLELLSESGVYSKDTGRVIRFSKQEIEQIVRNAPSTLTFGKGDDAKVECAQDLEHPHAMLQSGGPVGSPIPEEYYMSCLTAYMKEPFIDTISPCTAETVRGMDIRTRSPLEIVACWEEAYKVNMIRKIVGRPGLSYGGCEMSVSEIGQLSAAQGSQFQQGDTHTFGIISELKTDNGILCKVAHATMSGGLPDPYGNPIYGGLGGGDEGQAVLIVAVNLALIVFFQGAACGSSPTHPIYFNCTSRNVMNYTSIAFQAMANNTNLMTNLVLSPVGGPMTKTLLYEIFAYDLMATYSGISRMYGPRSATGAISGHFSPLEARFSGEVMRVAPSISKEKAEELVQKALDKFESEIPNKPYGKPYWEVYDVKTMKPTEEWLAMYNEVKEELISWGFPINQA